MRPELPPSCPCTVPRCDFSAEYDSRAAELAARTYCCPA
ncbi:mobile element transfer protein [Nocardia paucivorans]